MQALAADFAADDAELAGPITEIGLCYNSEHRVGVEDQVAIALEGNAELLAELRIHGVAFHIHLAAQRVGVRGDARVNHAVVARGGVHRNITFFIKQ